MSSIRWKLILVSVLVVLLPVYWLNRYAIEVFDRFTRDALEKQMRDTAFMIGEQYKVLAGQNTFEELLQSYEPVVQARLCLLSPSGIVLCDSGTNSLAGSDLSDRPEIRKAMDGQYGAAFRLTPDHQYMYYFVALPVLRGDELLAIAYVYRHTSPIIGAIKRMTTDQRIAATVALTTAILIAVLLAHTLTHRLRKLTRAAVAFSKGNAPWTARIRGRDEIGELAGAMGAMADEIDKRNRYNREFVLTLMHELKTPLTAVRGTVEILEDGAANDPAARARFLANIRYESERMIRLTGELNELSKLDVETTRSPREQVDYGSFLKSVIERLEPTFELPHAVFRTQIPQEKTTVWINPNRIEQVIANLLENAFRYTPPSGSVELSVTVNPDDTVTTTVRDTGTGISPANLGKVFDRFFTTEPKDQPAHSHSGLGLAIAKSIIEHHQGRIWAESEPEHGAAFSFTLATVPPGAIHN